MAPISWNGTRAPTDDRRSRRSAAKEPIMPVISSQKIEFVDIPQNARFKMLFDRAHSGTHHIALAQGELRPGARLFLHYHEFEEVVFITAGRGGGGICGVGTPGHARGGLLAASPVGPYHRKDPTEK